MMPHRRLKRMLEAGTGRPWTHFEVAQLNTVIAMISGNTRHAKEPTQVFVNPKIAAGSSSGLHGPSVVKCCNLYTVRQQDIVRAIGHLSDELLRQVDEALKMALSLS